MKTLLTSLIILITSVVSPVFGGVGDVYYCDSIKNTFIKTDGNAKIETPYTKFKFKWEGEEIEFDKSPLTSSKNTLKVYDVIEPEVFQARDRSPWKSDEEIFFFNNGNYLASYMAYEFQHTSVGTCSKF